MKKILNTLAVCLILSATLLFSSDLFGQPQPAAPPPPGEHGAGGDIPAGGGPAPVGSGLILMLVLGAGYGTKKVFDNRRKLTD